MIRVKSIFSFLIIMICVGIIGLIIAGFRPAIVMSGSMEPELRTGSICVINQNADYEDMEEGDIIAFERGEIEVTHRIIAVTDDGFYTKGDANASPDIGVVTPSDFIGETIFNIPYVGYAIHYLLEIPRNIMSAVS